MTIHHDMSDSDDGDVVMTDVDSTCTIEGAAMDGAPAPEPAPALPPLLRLPPELRAHIGQHALANGEAVSWPSADNPPRNIAAGALRICRALRDETAHALYASNALLFRHPSDANMFLHAHRPERARLVRRMLVHVADRDLALWTPYLSSTSQHRSLCHDYPRLRELLVVVRASAPLGGAPAQGHHHHHPHAHVLHHGGPPAQPQTAADAYKKWLPNQTVTGLCGSLQARAEAGLAVRVLYARFTPLLEDELALRERFPNDFPDLPEGPRLRTKYYAVLGCKVALDATRENNPWSTGELF
jgi:hypothetical protein